VAPVQSVQELLRHVMGVDVRERGPLGIQADISMRGGSIDQVMVLLNGVNITDPQTGHHTLNVPVDLNCIDRIEILNGPAARVYGPNAFSGAINIITGESKDSKATIRATGGDHGLYNLSAGASYNTGALKNFLSVQKGASDGYITNTDFDVLNLFYHGQLKLKNDKLSFQLGRTNKAFGANSFYTAKYPNQFESTHTNFASLSFETGDKIKLRPNLYWRRHNDRFELFRNNREAPSWYEGHNYHLTDVFGTGLNATIPSQVGVTSIGGEVRGESVWSNLLGVPMTNPIKVPGEPGAFFTKSFTRTNASVFLEHNLTLFNFSVSAGVMMNHNSQLGFGVDFFPGLDVSYWLTQNLKWMASYNKSLRLPTFTDLFYSGPTNFGNPDLKPEEASTVESGFRFSESWMDVQIGGFYRQGHDLIDWGRLPGETRYTTSNLNRVDAYGLEFSGNLNLMKLVPGQQLLRNLNVSYSYLEQDQEAKADYESYYVLDHLKHKLNLGFDHGLGLPGVSANWNFLYRDRVGYYTVSATNLPKAYSDFWLTDVRITWKYSNLSLFAEASNLFDEKYADLGELIQPGRWIKLGVQIELRQLKGAM
jgi:vitamin B12 transporter